MPPPRAGAIAFFISALSLTAADSVTSSQPKDCTSLSASASPADAEKFCQWTVRYTPSANPGIPEPAAKVKKSKTRRPAMTGPVVRIPRRY